MNIGIPPDGRIIPIFEERLRQIGKSITAKLATALYKSLKLLSTGSWLNISGEAIYKTNPWKYQNDTINNDFW